MNMAVHLHTITKRKQETERKERAIREARREQRRAPRGGS